MFLLYDSNYCVPLFSHDCMGEAKWGVGCEVQDLLNPTIGGILAMIVVILQTLSSCCCHGFVMVC